MTTLQKILLVAGLFIGILGTITLTQVLANQPLSSEDLRQELQNLISFSNESQLLITLYSQKEVTPMYMENQVDYVNQHVNDFYSQMASKHIPLSYRQSVATIGENVFDFSVQLKTIQDVGQDANKLQQIKNRIQNLKQEFQKEEKQYE